jgi:hypothetical protein
VLHHNHKAQTNFFSLEPIRKVQQDSLLVEVMTLRNILSVVCILLLFQANASAFSIYTHQRCALSKVVRDALNGDNEESSRRSFFSDVALTSIALTTAFSTRVGPARASGGATAGGVYLLSAKQRYNSRVTKAVKELLAAASTLEKGSSTEAKAFFSGDETGTWKDLTAAGYLLSNAFRRSSATPPDKLPAVKVRPRIWMEFCVLSPYLTLFSPFPPRNGRLLQPKSSLCRSL